VSLAWLRSVVYLQSISFHFLCYVLHCISMARHGTAWLAQASELGLQHIYPLLRLLRGHGYPHFLFLRHAGGPWSSLGTRVLLKWARGVMTLL
jgi:hypothetical protein